MDPTVAALRRGWGENRQLRRPRIVGTRLRSQCRCCCVAVAGALLSFISGDTKTVSGFSVGGLSAGPRARVHGDFKWSSSRGVRRRPRVVAAEDSNPLGWAMSQLGATRGNGDGTPRSVSTAGLEGWRDWKNLDVEVSRVGIMSVFVEVVSSSLLPQGTVCGCIETGCHLTSTCEYPVDYPLCQLYTLGS